MDALKFVAFIRIRTARGDLSGVNGLCRDRISIAKPLGEIKIAAARRAERRKGSNARLAAHRAGFGFGLHSAVIWACGLSSASAGLVAIRTCLPVRRESSSIHSDLSLDLRAG